MNLNPQGTGNSEMDQSALLQQMAELKTQLDSYKSELSDLRQQVSGTRRDSQLQVVTKEVTSRRKMMRRLAIGAAGIGALSVGSAMAYTPSDNAVDTTAGADGYGVNINAAGLAQIRLVPFGSGGAPAIAGHQVGEMYAAGNGNLYYAAGTGTGAATGWKALATAGSTGAFQFLGSVQRVTLAGAAALQNSTASTINVRTTLGQAGATGVAGVATIYASFGGGEYLTAGPGPSGGGVAVTTSGGQNKNASFVMVGLDANGVMNFTINGANNVALTFDVVGFFN